MWNLPRLRWTPRDRSVTGSNPEVEEPRQPVEIELPDKFKKIAVTTAPQLKGSR